MLEAEISVNGDVFVEGHHVGQLAGFRFTTVAVEGGSDAKAVLSAAQKALALEFEARAARMHAAGNSDLALSADGLVRWLGEPVARLAPSDHVMRPRVLLLADEQLTGNARDHVSARIERFVNYHISTVLKPLDDLSRAEDLQGLAKGLAFQLVENLGVLFRRDVTDEVKSLDQDARASMRRYGVRFGAYHIFMPALLKPAPAELITLLWALKNDGLDKPGYGDLIPVLAAGRTSVVTDPGFERNFYKLAGFRFLGKRAVRIDILERLADLIRPLLQWKPGAPQRPEGAYDGRRFTTTTTMLSILGATPDDMEEILKGLGYRADAVKPEEAAAYLASVTPAAGAAAAPAEAAPEARADDDAGDTTADSDSSPVEAAEAAPVAEEPAVATAVETADPTPVGEPAEAKLVLLWRPGGRNDNQRPAQRGGERRERPAGQREGQPRGDSNRSGERGEGEQAARGNRRDGQRSGDRPQGERPQGERKQGDRNQNNRGPRNEGDGNRGDRRPRNDRPPQGGQPQRFEAKPPRKDKPIDPDSPFAKLAALKEQMKK